MSRFLNSNSLSSQVVWGLCFLVAAVLAFLIAAFIRYKEKFPLSNRPSLLMAFFFPCLMMIAIMTPLARLVEVPCSVYFAVKLFSENIIITTYLLRGMYILFQLRVIEIVNRVTEWTATEETKQRGKNDWYMLNAKRFLSNKYYAIFLCVDALVCLGIILGLAMGVDSNHGLPAASACAVDAMAGHPLNLARIALLGVKLLLFAYMAVKLLPYGQDSGLVKGELRVLAVAALPLLVLYFVLLGAVGDAHKADAALAMYLLMVIVLVATSLGKTVYLALYMDVESEAYYYQGRQPDISNLADIINSKVGYLAFLQFLKSEFSDENLLFWREVQTFVNKCQKLLQGTLMDSSDMNRLLETKILNRDIAADLSKTAISTFDMYCRRGAAAQVNIGDTVLHELQTQLANLQAERVEVVLDKISNLFDSVKSQVFELMDKDSFARFKQSPIYNNLRANMVTSGWIDTSGGETMDSFDLPAGLIIVLDADAERVKAMERRKLAQRVDPEVIRQQKKDIRASKMLTLAAKMSRTHLLDMNNRLNLVSPVETQSVAYPYSVPDAYRDKLTQSVAQYSNKAAPALDPAVPAQPAAVNYHDFPPLTPDGRTPKHLGGRSGSAFFAPDEDEELKNIFNTNGGLHERGSLHPHPRLPKDDSRKDLALPTSTPGQPAAKPLGSTYPRTGSLAALGRHPEPSPIPAPARAHAYGPGADSDDEETGMGLHFHGHDGLAQDLDASRFSNANTPRSARHSNASLHPHPQPQTPRGAGAGAGAGAGVEMGALKRILTPRGGDAAPGTPRGLPQVPRTSSAASMRSEQATPRRTLLHDLNDTSSAPGTPRSARGGEAPTPSRQRSQVFGDMVVHDIEDDA